MELTIHRGVLLQGIHTVQRAVSTRTTIPVLANILLEAKQDTLKLFATDLEIGIECSIPANIKEKGLTTVPAKLFSELISNFSEEEIYLKTDDEKNLLLINCGGGNYRLNILPADDYPSLPEIKKGVSLKFPSDILKNTIKSVAFAAAPPTEARVALTGVLFEVKGTTLKMVATNAHRLSLKSTNIEKTKNDISRILPTKTLQEVSRLIKDDEEVDITLTENQVKFTTQSVIIYSRCIEGQFPPYEQVIPSSYKRKWKVPTSLVLQATKRISALAKEDTNVVRYKAKGNKLSIETLTQDVGFGVETIDIEQEGEDIEIAFNAEYLLDFLSRADSERLIFELNTETTAVLIKPENEDNYFYIIMPIKTT